MDISYNGYGGDRWRTNLQVASNVIGDKDVTLKWLASQGGVGGVCDKRHSSCLAHLLLTVTYPAAREASSPVVLI